MYTIYAQTYVQILALQGDRKGERERERETEKERDRQTKRQRERETERGGALIWSIFI